MCDTTAVLPALHCAVRVALQGYLLVLWDTSVGLLGAAYLLLLVMVLIAAPELPTSAADRQTRQSTRGSQRAGRGGRTAAALGAAATDEESQLQEPLLSAEGSSDEAQRDTQQGSRGCGGSTLLALRWLLPALLALLCAADLSVQYALVVGSLVQEHPLLPPDVVAWIRTVVGIDDQATGTTLLLALLRPTLLMAGLAVYRWVISLGTVAVCLALFCGCVHLLYPVGRLIKAEVAPVASTCHTCNLLSLQRCCRDVYGIGIACAAPAQGTATGVSANQPGSHQANATLLAAQGSLGWLLRRLVIRHADLLLGAACIAAALQAPTALGLVLAAGTLIAALQQGFSHKAAATAATRRWHRRAAALSDGGSASSGGSSVATPVLRPLQQQQAGRQSGRWPRRAVSFSGGLSASEQARAFKAQCAASEHSLSVFVGGITVCVQVLVAAWLLAQYLLQVAWLRDLLFAAFPPLLPWLLLWLGLPVAGDGGPTQVPGLTLEAMLRMKALVLVASALRHKAQRWQQQLPQAVVEAAEAHWPCPLFWPPAKGSDSSEQPTAGSGSAAGAGGAGADAPAVGASSTSAADAAPWDEFGPVLRRAGQLVSLRAGQLVQLLHQVGLVTARVLNAMDLPEGTAQAIAYTFDPETYFGSSSNSSPATPHARWRARLSGWHAQLRWCCGVVATGLRQFVEGFWERWGGECTMLLLLTAALVGANAVSLLFLLLVVLGMATAAVPQHGREQQRGVAGTAGSSTSNQRGNSSSAESSLRSAPVSWWWWHLLLAVLVVVLVSMDG